MISKTDEGLKQNIEKFTFFGLSLRPKLSVKLQFETEARERKIVLNSKIFKVMMIIIETKNHKLISELNEDVQNLHAKLHPELFKKFDKEAMEKALETLFLDPNCKCYIVKKGDVDIGYILCFIKEAKENAFQYNIKTLYIDQISILPKYQRTGAGKILMKQAEQLAQENSITKIELDHWSSNTVAASYFRKNGYKLYKERLFKMV